MGPRLGPSTLLKIFRDGFEDLGVARCGAVCGKRNKCCFQIVPRAEHPFFSDDLQERQRDLKAKEEAEREAARIAEEAKKLEKPKSVSKQMSVVTTPGPDEEREEPTEEDTKLDEQNMTIKETEPGKQEADQD